jgi:polysaccharide export outer membrane protein
MAVTLLAIVGLPPLDIKAQPRRVVYDSYILGPGDSLQVELLDLPELSGTFSIGPDGTLYLPRLRALYVEGLTVEELRYFLTDQFKTYVRQPQLYVRPVGYRPVRVYVGGEIQRPGYYLLSGSQLLPDQLDIPEASAAGTTRETRLEQQDTQFARPRLNSPTASGVVTGTLRAHSLFDALRAAQGVTPYSNLTQVRVTRKQPLSAGGGKIKADVNFLSLITSGDESVNIRLFDGDTIQVGRSSEALREQLMAASRTNLSPDFIEVFVSGRVKEPGPQGLPQGATLNQAIASAGGTKLLRGNVEFLRFSREGTTDRRVFGYNPSAQAGDYKNPVLMAGDVVRVNDSLFSATVEVLNEVTGPAVGVYSVYSLFKP